MRRTKRVVTSPKFRTTESPLLLNSEASSRSVVVGRRGGDDQAAGLFAKVCEQSSASSILDYGVWFDLSFPHVVGIFGTRGSGKSFDLGVLAECISGDPSVVDGDISSSATIFFDIQNQFWTLGLAPDESLTEDRQQLRALEEWELSPRSLQNTQVWLPQGTTTTLPGTRDFSIAPGQLSTDDWLSMLNLERYSPMGQVVLQLVADHPGATPSDLVTHAVPGTALAAFQDSTIDGVRWRLQGLADTQLVADPGLDIADLLQPGAASVLLLRDLPEALRSLVVGVVARLVAVRMGRFHQARRIARRQHTDVPDEALPMRVWMLVDEAHTVVPNGRTTSASSALIDYVKRGRDAGLSLIFATQQPSAVDADLMSQVDMTLTHLLGFEADLQAAVQRMPTRSSITYEAKGSRFGSLSDAIRSLDPGEALVADASSGRVFVVRIRPRVTAHGGNTPV